MWWLALLGILVGAALVAAWFETRRLTVERIEVGTSAGGEPVRVAFVSDMHFRDGSRVPDRLFAEAVDVLKREGADVVVLGGDFVTRWSEASLSDVREGLSALMELDRPTFAILGNHDYYDGEPEKLLAVFSELGVKLLRNESVLVEGVCFVGLDSSHQEEDDPDRALFEAQDGCRRVVLWHEPDAVDRLAAGSADLMLAGHTHGGQFMNPWGWGEFGTKNGKRYNKGMFEKTPIPLYVSRGIGTVGVHLRLFSPPELTLVTLR